MKPNTQQPQELETRSNSESPMELTKKQYTEIKDLVYNSCGINLHKGKLSLLKNRLSKRLRATGITDINDYIRFLKHNNDEFISFIDTISTNHTYFFRENRHCEFLLENLDKSKHIKIWSAASSSGEEPFSIAFQLLNKNFRFTILASDISTAMLKVAARGIYHKNKFKLVPGDILKKYCLKGHNEWEGYIKIKKEVISMVSFERLNLLSDPVPDVFDVIFCRNVMIYFDIPTKTMLVNKLAAAIKPGGYLIIGASEGLVGINHYLQYIEPSIYKKK